MPLRGHHRPQLVTEEAGGDPALSCCADTTGKQVLGSVQTPPQAPQEPDTEQVDKTQCLDPAGPPEGRHGEQWRAVGRLSVASGEPLLW